MLLTEYNEAEVMELFKEDGRREGRREGRQEGRKEGRQEGRKEEHIEVQSVYSWLFKNGRGHDAERASNDEKFYDQVLEEYKHELVGAPSEERRK